MVSAFNSMVSALKKVSLSKIVSLSWIASESSSLYLRNEESYYNDDDNDSNNYENNLDSHSCKQYQIQF